MILGIGAITGFIALYQGIVTTSYTIETEKLTDEQSFRIVLLTDLHSCIYGGDQGPLIHKILVQKPDAVLMAGDILDDRAPVDGVRLLLAKLMGRVPLYYATGNHEFWTRDIDAVLEVFRDYDVTILDDRWEETTLNGVPVVIAGVSDPVRETFDRGFNARQAMAEGFADLPEDKFCVLMAHRPNWITEYRKYPFDLVLSGHNHGGQFRIPFLLNGLVGPDEGFFPKYPGGKYQHGKLTQIVGRGLSINPKLPRVFNPPELVVVDVRGTHG
ncbi:MAG: metallophosphoesterase [Intestinibacillus sp.]